MSSFGDMDDWRCRKLTTKVIGNCAAFTEMMEIAHPFKRRSPKRKWSDEGDLGVDVVSAQVPNSWAQSCAQVEDIGKKSYWLKFHPSTECVLTPFADVGHQLVNEMWSMRTVDTPIYVSRALPSSMVKVFGLVQDVFRNRNYAVSSSVCLTSVPPKEMSS